MEAGYTFFNIGSFSVRRGALYPRVICYCWRGTPVLQSLHNGVIVNREGERELFIGLFNVGYRGWMFAVQFGGRDVLRININLRAYVRGLSK